MTTEVIITGTGVPVVTPGRAGPGALVRHEDTFLQFDAGLATALRLAEAGVDCGQLDALFITHHHTDHVTGAPEVVLGRYLQDPANQPAGPFPCVAPDGPSSYYLERMLEPLAKELEGRAKMPKLDYPEIDLRAFNASQGALPAEVWSDGKGVTVTAFAVTHGNIVPSVGYRVETPDGVVVISGDTIVCPTLEEAAMGADILVNEVVCSSIFDEMPANSVLTTIRSIHSESNELGAMAQRCGVRSLVLTHLVPPIDPSNDAARARFEADIRASGYTGDLVVANDLDRVSIGS